jgi:uroporphyrinogen decarboxylase
MKVIAWDDIPQCKDEPNFGNLLTVFQRQVPNRSTLFEFFLNDRLYRRLVPGPEPADETARMRRVITAFYRLGYDYATILIPSFSFKEQVVRRVAKSISTNEGAVIHNRQEFNKFAWPDADIADYDILDRLAQDLPKGMKLILFSPDGVLENVINLLGYEALCYMLVDDLQLVEDVVAQVGTRLVRYYEKAMSYECVGACISNDDWGFKTGTLLSPPVLRRLIFPWHKRIVEVVHAAGKPIILHSCGYFEQTIEDIIENMKFEGRHSYEDTIMTVEMAYEKYHDRIAIIGGIDVDFICRSNPEDVYHRSKAMMERVSMRGGYALGSGNSIPEYVPDANYFAMVRAALDLRER